MCNRIHEEHWPAPEEGEMWKIFKVYHPKPCTFYQVNLEGPIGYVIDNSGWVKWIDKYEVIEGFRRIGDGFCGFTTEEEAKICMERYWNTEILPYIEDSDASYVVRKVKYKGGICIQEEHLMFSQQEPGKHYETILVKEFEMPKE